MPVTRSRAKAASPPDASASASSSSSAAGGAAERTPTPSPSTSLRLGIGPTSPDNGAGSLDLEKPAAAPPRHSLRLAGAALRLGLGPSSSPDDDVDVVGAGAGGSRSLSPSAATPLRRSLRLAGAAAGSSSSGSGSGSGSGSAAGEKRAAGRPRARVPASSVAATVSPTTLNSGSDGGGSGAVRALASGDRSGGLSPSLSRIGKRRMEASAQAGGEAGVGSAPQGQVLDEMLHRDAGTPTKRCKTILVGGVETVYVSDTESDSDVGGVETVYVSDTESDSDEDCVMLGPRGVELNPVAVNMDRTENGGMDDPANASNGESLQVHNLLQTASVFEKFSLWTANGGVVDQLPYPSGSPSSFEAKVSAVKEDLSQYSSRKEVKVEEKLVLGNNNSRADANVGSAVGTNGASLQTHNLLQTAASVFEKFSFRTANGGVVDQLPYSSGSPSSFEAKVSADMYLKEDLSQYSSRKEVKVEEKLILGNNNSRADANVGSAVGTSSSKFNADSKGKGKMVVEDSLSSLSSIEDKPDFDPVDSKETQLNPGSVSVATESNRRQTVRERAIRLAPKFAFFKADKDEHSEDEEEEEELEPSPDAQDWPGPFATAAGIYEQRAAKLRARELNSSEVHKPAKRVIVWSPSKDRKNPARAQAAPSLTSLCLNTLAEHSECIESLGGIPEELKQKLLRILCHSRKMNTHLLHELLCDNPTELHLIECSWLSEDDFEKTFGKCSTESLQDLQLDISGRCMPDYMLPTTLAKVPSCMPLLRKISLKGNYRISDNGLGTIISAAPSLSSINLCECSLLTSSGIDILANKLHSVLRELYIDDCTNVDAMAILPALQKIDRLEVLSMSGVQSVCDKFVKELIPVHGSNLKELAFAGCLELTSSSIKTIGEYCQKLTSLDLRNLDRLRDSAMRHLRGCRLIRKLKLQRNAFSDEAVSRYLEESGGCLTELMLNNVKKVGDLTALAISRKCSVLLEALDLSFCRELTDEALGLIADSCQSLRILKLFGCTQVTDLFLKGHSNTLVKIVGIEGSILVQMDNC